jgi:hypothetical protein
MVTGAPGVRRTRTWSRPVQVDTAWARLTLTAWTRALRSGQLRRPLRRIRTADGGRLSLTLRMDGVAAQSLRRRGADRTLSLPLP